MDRYLVALKQVASEAWAVEPASGKWSPAEVTQHLILYYEVGAEAVAGRTTLRPRTSGWMQRMLRWILLPHILFHGSFPIRAVAPREIRPEGTPASFNDAPERLRRAADTAEAAILATRERPGATFDHPYFGTIRPLRLLRLSTVHLDHHRKQVEATVSPADSR